MRLGHAMSSLVVMEGGLVGAREEGLAGAKGGGFG